MIACLVVRCAALWLAVAIALATLGSGPADATERLALVIANARYTSVPPLLGPDTDRQLLQPVLESIGYKVTVVKNASFKEMTKAIQLFAARLRQAPPGSIALVYYSGHGVAVPGSDENYLLPVDLPGLDADDVKGGGVSLRSLAEALTITDRFVFLVIDACRNELRRAASSVRDLSIGFAPQKQLANIVFVFSTAPGAVAGDGGIAGSPYARAFVKALGIRCVDYQATFKAAQIEVANDTKPQQTPWSTDGMATLFALAADCPAIRPGAAGAQSIALERVPVGAMVINVTGSVSPRVRDHVMLAVRDDLGGATLASDAARSTATHTLRVTARGPLQVQGGCGWQTVTTIAYALVENQSGRTLVEGEVEGAECLASASVEAAETQSVRSAAQLLVRDLRARLERRKR